MNRTLIALIFGIILGFILAMVVSPPYQVSVNSSNPRGVGSIKTNKWTGRTWVLWWSGEGNLQSGDKRGYYWEELREKR
jgi:hypothetical protein